MLFLIKLLIIIIFVLISVAYLTLVERKILAVIQRRQGPNVIGIYGLLQPLNDGLKLLLKEKLSPSSSNQFMFFLSPMLSLAFSLQNWAVIPFSPTANLVNVETGILFIIATSSLGVYGIIISGWASNSKYAFLGGLRSSAQILSYELSMTFSILTVLLIVGSFDLNQVVEMQRYAWMVITVPLSAGIFFIASLAETNRHPFDLPEAESELVSGYNTEYSGMSFALFSLAEYSSILLMCFLNSILFFGGWHPPFFFPFFAHSGFWLSIKVIFFATLFIYVRAILPRYRYDQLMFLGWKSLLPLSLSMFLWTMCIIYAFDIFPPNE